MVVGATLADGTTLPSWLVFDAVNLRFSGASPGKIGSISVRMTARDLSGNQASSVLTLVFG
jgi:hypothetical protein